MRATVRRSRSGGGWFWWTGCLCLARTGPSGFAPTQPEALVAALAHLATHHPKEDQS